MQPLLFIADLHLDNYRPFSTILQNGMNSRLLDQLNVVKDVTKLIEDKQPEAVIFLGDLFNGITESLPKIIYNAGFLTAKAWSKVCPLYIIVGNHDIYRGMHVFSSFESLPNVHIISQTTKVSLAGHEIDLIPWENPLPKEKGDICAGHLEVRGALMDAAQKKFCETGIHPSQFLGYNYVFLGHFHNPQELQVPGISIPGRAQYIGSLMQTDRRRSSGGYTGVLKLDDEGYTFLHSIDSPRIFDVFINSQEGLDQFLKDRQQQHYYKVTITRPDLDLEVNSHTLSVEYDLPAIVTSRLQMDEKDFSDIVGLQTAIESFIDNANTALDKGKIKELSRSLLR